MTRRHFLIASMVVLFGGLPFIGEVVRAWARRATREELARPPEHPLLLDIKSLVDYEGWARKVYRVRPCPQGEMLSIQDLRRLGLRV